MLSDDTRPGRHVYEKKERNFTPLEREHLNRKLAEPDEPQAPQRAKADWPLRLKWIAGSAAGSAILLWLFPSETTAVICFFWWILVVMFTVPRPPPPTEAAMSAYRRELVSHKHGVRRFEEFVANGRACVERIEANRVVLLEEWNPYLYPMYLYDVGDGRMYAIEAEHYRPKNDAPWPNSVFEIVTDPRPKHESHAFSIFALGDALEPRVIKNSELQFGRYKNGEGPPEEGLLEGSLDDPARAYEPYAAEEAGPDEG